MRRLLRRGPAEGLDGDVHDPTRGAVLFGRLFVCGAPIVAARIVLAHAAGRALTFGDGGGVHARLCAHVAMRHGGAVLDGGDRLLLALLLRGRGEGLDAGNSSHDRSFARHG